MLIGLTVTSKTNVAIHHQDETQVKLEQLFTGLPKARDGSDAKVIEHLRVAEKPTDTDEQEPLILRAGEEEAADAAPVVQHPVLTPRAAASPHRPEAAEPPLSSRYGRPSPSAPRTGTHAAHRSAETPRNPPIRGTVPGIFAAVVLGDEADNRITTEKFYEWSGNTGWRL
jgi:hypothetical protein